MQDYNIQLYDGLKSNNIQAICTAIANGANINKSSKPSEEDIIPLYHACDIQNFELIQILVEAGCDVNIGNPEKNGMTPLICACQKGNIDIVRFLLDSGADINLECEQGYTPLANACSYENINIVKLLIERGADINHSSFDDENPILIAVKSENSELVETLLQSPAIDLNVIDLYGDTPLGYAVDVSNFDITLKLLLHGASIPNEFEYEDDEHAYYDEIIELLKMWPTLVNLYGLNYLGILQSIDSESICMLKDMLT